MKLLFVAPGPLVVLGGRLATFFNYTIIIPYTSIEYELMSRMEEKSAVKINRIFLEFVFVTI